MQTEAGPVNKGGRRRRGFWLTAQSSSWWLKWVLLGRWFLIISVSLYTPAALLCFCDLKIWCHNWHKKASGAALMANGMTLWEDPCDWTLTEYWSISAHPLVVVLIITFVIAWLCCDCTGYQTILIKLQHKNHQQSHYPALSFRNYLYIQLNCNCTYPLWETWGHSNDPLVFLWLSFVHPQKLNTSFIGKKKRCHREIMFSSSVFGKAD